MRWQVQIQNVFYTFYIRFIVYGLLSCLTAYVLKGFKARWAGAKSPGPAIHRVLIMLSCLFMRREVGSL